MDVKNCGFFAQSPIRFCFGWDEEDEQCIMLKQVILQQIQLLRRQGCNSFFVVPDSGAGLWFCEIINVIRNNHSDLMLQCILPHEELATKWHPALRQRYFTVLEECTHLTTAARPDDSDAVEKALKYMIKQCDFVVAVYNPRLNHGSAIDYAMTDLYVSKKTCLLIDPETLEMKLLRA